MSASITKPIFVIVCLLAATTTAYNLPKRKAGLSAPFKGSSVLDEVPLVDGHNDLPMNIYDVVNNHLDLVDLRKNLSQDPVWREVETSQTDIPRLRAGKVGGQFWVAYTNCRGLDKDAAEKTFDQIDVIKRMINKYSDVFQYTTTSAGIWDAFEQGKIASLIAVEGGHSMDNRLGILRMFYEMGVRYMTLTHTCNLPWADASPIDEEPLATKHNLTNWGRKVVTEMNRLGMMVDISHVSKGVMIDVMKVTRAPVIFSHSNAWTVRQHHRNVHDEVLLELKRNHGIIMVSFYPNFLGGDSISKIIEHLNYIRNLIGTDNVGIGSGMHFNFFFKEIFFKSFPRHISHLEYQHEYGPRNIYRTFSCLYLQTLMESILYPRIYLMSASSRISSTVWQNRDTDTSHGRPMS